MKTENKLTDLEEQPSKKNEGLIDLSSWVKITSLSPDEKEFVINFAEIRKHWLLTDLEEQRKRKSLYRDLLKLKDYVMEFFENQGMTFVTAKLGNAELQNILPILSELENNWVLEGHGHTWGIVDNYGNPRKWENRY